MKTKNFTEFILQKHPDPDSLIVMIDHGRDSKAITGYEIEQITRLAEKYAEYRIVQFQKKRMIEKGLNGA